MNEARKRWKQAHQINRLARRLEWDSPRGRAYRTLFYNLAIVGWIAGGRRGFQPEPARLRPIDYSNKDES